MGYNSIMVRLDLSKDNTGVLSVAGGLAERFGSKVIGIAACQPLQILADEGFSAGEAIVQNCEEIAKEIEAAEAQFRAALSGRVREIEWRSNVTYDLLADYIAEQARAADLIITGKDVGPSFLDESHRVRLGDLVMRAGRPVLIVPDGVKELAFRHVFVGWKDAREARRAVVDALPLLAISREVTVLEVAPEYETKRAQDRVEDVTAWLAKHNVRARSMTDTPTGLASGYLHARLLTDHCDLLVAGAYGHNRVREWVFGGVTQDVLLDPEFCVLISH